MKRPMNGWALLILSGCSPPPEDKTPGNLIYAFGVEMLRLGMELTLEMFTSDKENTGN